MHKHLPQIILLGLLLLTGPAFAKDSYFFNGGILGQTRKENGKQQWPTDTYVGAGWRDQESSWKASGNFHLHQDFNPMDTDPNLYEARIQGGFFKEKVHLSAGRQFISPGMNTWLVDGIEMEARPQETWSISTYAGIPRFIDIGDFNKDDGMISGLGFRIHSLGGFTGQVGAHYRKKDLQGNDWLENDQLFGTAYLQYQFQNQKIPTLYSGLEYDASGISIDQITSGFDWHPHKMFDFNGAFDLFDDNRKEGRETILSRFTGGKTWQGRMGTRQKPHKNIELFQEYSYSNLEIPSGIKKNHHEVLAGITYHVFSIDMELTPTYQWTKSYGGTLHLAALRIAETINDWWSFFIQADYARFSKITNDNGAAVSTVLWNEFQIFKEFSLSINGEFLKDNDVSKEFRGGLALRWNLGAPSYPATGKGLIP